jgi:hypothetical protein
MVSRGGSWALQAVQRHVAGYDYAVAVDAANLRGKPILAERRGIDARVVHKSSDSAEAEVLAVGHEFGEAPVAQHNDVSFGIS